ncbi:PAS domain S-box-containing protein [Hydrogenispora ethanolica]|uniref:Circadian input-output histidine kinase CikA n=1 Tax=Hydrogenispora ethanolica TaxID=1082276 RepID=A0A4V2QDL9_HYDET|nr:PAS domain S-box protein [Hydrogenispora ethanolica]TCL64767.1 PAS domain S-box-containing protein [Hydrogenispora ethanolica]
MNFAEALHHKENWLIQRITAHAVENHLSDALLILQKDDLISVPRLSQKLILAWQNRSGFSMDPVFQNTVDSVSSEMCDEQNVYTFQVPFPILLALLKCFRRSYLEFIGTTEELPENAAAYIQLIERFFDCFEVSLCEQWTKQESENRYHRFVENLPDAFFAQSQGKIVYANQGFLRLLGFEKKEQVYGKSIYEFVHPDFYQLTQQRLMELEILGNSTPLVEMKYVNFAENAIDVEVASTAVRLDPGTPGSLSIVRDITARKHFEQALLESEARYNSLFEMNNSVMLLIDPDTGAIVDGNAAAAEFYGFSKSVLKTLNIMDINVLSLAEIRSEMKRVVKLEKRLFIFKHRLASGEIREVEVYSGPIKVNQRNLLYSIIHDITERKEAQDELRRTKEWLELLCRVTPSAVFSVDSEGMITSFNDVAAELTGFSPQEVIGKPCRMFAPTPCVKGACGLYCPDVPKPVMSIECRMRKKNGQWMTVLKSADLLRDPDGKIIGGVESFIDITERKETEQALEMAKNAAEAANRAKSEFLANMSHEIRTPMNGIIGMTELALQTELDREQRDYLQMVKNSADLLLEIINDILDFSKIEAGQLELETVDFNLREMIEKTVETLAVTAHQKRIELSYQIDSSLPPVLHGDPGRISQILTNLIGNAVKFTAQGEVVVKIGWGESTPGRIAFTVRDTGIGIPAEKMDRLFKSFSQVDGSISRKYGGTGLGLAISKHLVEMMNGHIQVKSTPGEGSTFQFEIPYMPPLVQTKVISQSVHFNGSIKTLIIDDNETNRLILKDILRNLGFSVSLAANGVEGLALLQNAAIYGIPYHFVLLDVNMPEMDGFAVAETIKSQPELRNTIIMMLTSDAVQGDLARCRKLGIESYLVKPVRQGELIQMMAHLIYQRGLEESETRELRQAGETTLPQAKINNGPLQSPTTLRILLAEDNIVNQKLAETLLRNRGWRVTTAVNGKECLTLWEHGQFDLILMDVQMPELDGFETTSIIRQKEMSINRHIPIIAMTAHALKGDRERCLAAGMDDYLAKPIKMNDLYRVITRNMTQGSSNESIIDLNSLRENLSNDSQLLAELIKDFLKVLPTMIDGLWSAFDARDDNLLYQKVHSVRGAISNFGAVSAQELALQLESVIRESQFIDAEPLLVRLVSELKWIEKRLVEELPS